MHGRVWFIPSLFLLSSSLLVAPSFRPLTAQTVLLENRPSPAAQQPAQKKRSAVTKGPRAASPTTAKSRRKPTSPCNSRVSPDQPRKNPAVRRYAAQHALLRRLAAAGLLRGPGFGESRVLEIWRIRLVDGDTFWYGGERIRIRGYDAPERFQPGSIEAAQRLDVLLHEGEVRMYSQGLDTYGRTLADVFVEQRNVADVMIAAGYGKKR